MPATTTTEAVISVIRAEMGRRRLSQSTLAQRLGMSRTALSRRMNGELSLNLAEIDAIAAVLGVPATLLLAGDGQI